VETSSISVINLSDYLDSGKAGGFKRGSVDHGYSDSDIVKKTSSCCELELSEGLIEEDYLICSPTVPGFCFRDKLWYKNQPQPLHGVLLTFLTEQMNLLS
jgi:hypothetical protein